MTYSISGFVGGKEIRFDDIPLAAEALRKYREQQATGQVTALWIHEGARQITLEELKRLAGER